MNFSRGTTAVTGRARKVVHCEKGLLARSDARHGYPSSLPYQLPSNFGGKHDMTSTQSLHDKNE